MLSNTSTKTLFNYLYFDLDLVQKMVLYGVHAIGIGCDYDPYLCHQYWNTNCCGIQGRDVRTHGGHNDGHGVCGGIHDHDVRGLRILNQDIRRGNHPSCHEHE